MANNMTGVPRLGFTNCVKATPAGITSGSHLSNASNYVSITAMRARLTAINAGYFTSSRLDKMTVNDMVYAIRLADDPTTIKQ